MKKISFIIFILCLIIGLEVWARKYLGLGELATYREDAQFEYIYSPNQTVNRHGTLIRTNKYSMRSQALKQNERRILMFGDSVLNGGNFTDHSELATTLLENRIQHSCDKSIRILNASAVSWGPDNAYAYLMKYGDFNASEIILVFSSHDAYDNMSHKNIIGIHPSYPSDTPYLALTDGFTRYFIPKVKSLFSKSQKKDIKEEANRNDKETFNSGWKNFIRYSKSHKIKLTVILHPTTSEVEKGAYNSNGMLIIDLLKKNNIPFILELENNTSLDYYRDEVHYNKEGQRFMSSEIFRIIKNDNCKAALQ